MASADTFARIKELGDEVLPADIAELGGKRQYLEEVIQYCESSYLTEDKQDILGRTVDYVEDALGAITGDIEKIANCLLEVLSAQQAVVEDITDRTTKLATRLRHMRDQRGQDALIGNFVEDVEDVKAPPIQFVKDNLRPMIVAPAGRVNLRDRFSTFDELGTTLVKESVTGGNSYTSLASQSVCGGVSRRTSRLTAELLKALHDENQAAEAFDGGGDVAEGGRPTWM